MTHSKFVGVDGCKYGWVSVGLNEDDGFDIELFFDFKQLLSHFYAAQLILVDIPIGLSEGPERRICDGNARSLLGAPRSSSVFTTPSRQTVHLAADPHTVFQEALQKERCVSQRGLSKQAFSIAKKIAQVDSLMTERQAIATPQVREIHPEICFWALDGGKPMQYRKKTTEGLSKRLKVLCREHPKAEEIYESALSKFLRKDVAKDDVVDALVAAVTGRYGCGQLSRVPDDDQRDERGLPMEMVYWEP